MSGDIEAIIARGMERISCNSFPAIRQHAVRMDSSTYVTVTYNHLTGDVSWPAGAVEDYGSESRSSLPGKPYGEDVIVREDPRDFSEVDVAYKFGDSSVPYTLMKHEGTDNVIVRRLGDCQFNFGMAEGDRVIVEILKRLNAQRGGKR